MNTTHGERLKHRFPGNTLLAPTFMEFIKLKSLPVVGQLTEQNTRLYESTGRMMLTVFTAIDHVDNPQNFQNAANCLRQIAKLKIAKNLLFNVADIDEFQYTMQLDYGFSPMSSKNVHVGLKYNNFHFAMKNEFTVEATIRFIEGFHAGAIKGKLKVCEPSSALSFSCKLSL